MIKTLIEFIANWIKQGRKFETFVDVVNPTLHQISLLRLDWCKVEMLTSNEFGTGGWLADMYLGYARLLPVLYCYISKIYDHQSIDTIPIFRLIIAAYSCVCHLMTMVPVESSMIDDYVKILLSCWYEINSDLKNPFWYQPNIVSFLNFKSQIDRFGSIRYYWEGNRER